MSKTIYYARVSSKDQNLQRQLDAFHADGAMDGQIITEKASGKDFERVKYQTMKQTLGIGDTLVVMSIDRLGRTKDGIKQELKDFRDKGVRVRILDLPTYGRAENNSELDLINDLLIDVLTYLAEKERKMIRERQHAGIEAAKKAGKYKGRKPKTIDEDKLGYLYEKYIRREISKAEMARRMGVSRNTMDRMLKRRGLKYRVYMNNKAHDQ